MHYWADLQSVHGFRYYDIKHICKLIALYTANAYSAECELSASTCTRSMAGSMYYFVSFSARQNNFHVVFCCPSHRILATPLAVEDWSRDSGSCPILPAWITFKCFISFAESSDTSTSISCEALKQDLADLYIIFNQARMFSQYAKCNFSLHGCRVTLCHICYDTDQKTIGYNMSLLSPKFHDTYQTCSIFLNTCF